jgi:glutamate--cysteine ligase
MPKAGKPTRPPTVRLHDRAAAEAYVASVCFKHGPPQRLGVELEWIVQHADDPGRPLDADHLADALGVHAPPTIRPNSPHHPLPAGSALTVEPGGQVEISTPPRGSLSELLATATTDIAAVTELIIAAGLRLAGTATDPYRPPRRLLDSPRYRAMDEQYRRDGASGGHMMCGTAAVQPCLDVGGVGQLPLRWAALYALGPVLVAAFANSPGLAGRATGWASTRMALWAAVRYAACPPGTDAVTLDAADPIAGYSRHVLDAPLLCVRRPGGWLVPRALTFADWLAGALPDPPTTDDLDYHLTTVFPPVRPHGRHLEVRYVDAQPPGGWPLPVAVLAALLSSDAAAEAATELAAPAAGRWLAAARHGLADPTLAAAAAAVFQLACRLLPDLAPPGWLQCELELVTERRVCRGRSAAVEPDAAEPAAAVAVVGRS